MSINKRREAVKVVLRDTQYVQTDSMSFKSVVQKLTGKDCSVAWIKESSSSSADHAKSGGGSAVVDDRKLESYGGGGEDGSVSNIMLSKGLSFNHLDRLMMLEAPPPEELQWLWSTECNLR